MQRLSVLEFKSFCEEMSQHCFIFDSVNQDWSTIDETMKIKQNYDKVKISFNPNTIYLYSSFGKLIFERVKYIEIGEPSLLGIVFNIVCGDFLTNKNNKSYTIIVA